MQKRKLKKFKYMRQGCMISGVAGFLLLASIPDNMPDGMIIVRAVTALLVMALSWITYRYIQYMECRYIQILKRKQEMKKSA